MSHARTQHPNARLIPRHSRNMVGCVIDEGWTIEATAERFEVDAKTVAQCNDAGDVCANCGASFSAPVGR
jgi:hypothetical protein